MSYGRTVFPVILQLSLENSPGAILILEGLVVGGLDYLLKGIPLVGKESHIPYHRLSGAEDQLHVQIHSFEESRKERQHSHEDQQSKARFLKSTKETFAHCLGTFFISVVCMQTQKKIINSFFTEIECHFMGQEQMKAAKFIFTLVGTMFRLNQEDSTIFAAQYSGGQKSTKMESAFLLCCNRMEIEEGRFFWVQSAADKRSCCRKNVCSSSNRLHANAYITLSKCGWVITSSRLSQWYQ